MDWQTLSTYEHAEQSNKAALLPIGTLEAHGAGPVGTDNLIPQALCERLSARLGMRRLPVMPYGVTSSLLAYPGSCTLSPKLLEEFLVEVGRSLHGNGLRQLFVINGHGGNTTALRSAAGRLYQDAGLYTAVFDWWVNADNQPEEFFGEKGMGHAAIDEMGALLGLCPELAEAVKRDSLPAYRIRSDVKVYPSPRPILTYREGDAEVDFSRLTPERCGRFADRITVLLESAIQEIRRGWDEMPR